MSTHVLFRHALRAATLFTCMVLATSSVAQKVDAEFSRAISKIYAGGFTGQIIKEWCDERVPNLSTQNARVLEAWRIKMDLPAIDARLVNLLGAEGQKKVTANLEGKRSELYDQLDQSSPNAKNSCAELSKSLNENLNLKVLYANEYAILAAQPAATTGTGSEEVRQAGNGSSTPVAKLPVMPAFDYRAFAKLNIDPRKEPIPDEYHCHAAITGDQYATHLLTLQILPGRKYRAALGKEVYEGAFRVGGLYLYFTSGALRSNRGHFYLFSHKEGATLTLRDLGSEEYNLDFNCVQRGGPEQLVQLRFKRQDPQPGTYACVTTDGSNKAAGALEVLPNRRYRYQGSEGAYKVNITGDTMGGTDSRLVFNGGGLDDQFADYEESEEGQQTYDFYRPQIECKRQVTARPNPKFGTAKAPAAPGTGGLEGRYFLDRQQTVDLNNTVPCQGICYSYLIFQKNGYVYNDDLEATEGLSDADCSKTYPSGFPVCQTYTVKGKMLQIGLGKPETFAKTKAGIKIDGDDWDVLEALDGLKFNLAYSSQRVTGTLIGTGGGSSSTGLALRKDGRFTHESSSSFFFGATDTGTAQGNITGSASGSSSRQNSGSYRVYGNTIEFKYDDGRLLKLFMFLPGGRRALSFLHIGGGIYSEDKPSK